MISVRPFLSRLRKQGEESFFAKSKIESEINCESGISDEMSSVALEPFILGNLSNNVTLEIRVHFRGHGGWAGESWGKMCRDQSVG